MFAHQINPDKFKKLNAFVWRFVVCLADLTSLAKNRTNFGVVFPGYVIFSKNESVKAPESHIY